MDFKYLELVLENCEVVRVERKYLGYLYIGDIKTTLTRHDKSLIKSQSIGDFAIELHRDLKDEDTSFGAYFGKVNPIDRLVKHKDITQIYIAYEGNTSDRFYVKWHDNDEHDNRYQNNKLNNFGDLYIVISEDKGIDDFYEDELINDEECVQWNWEEYKEVDGR